jgi:O-antigen ligase
MQILIKKINTLIYYLYGIYVSSLMFSLLVMEVVQYLIMLLLLIVIIYELIVNKKFIFEKNYLNILSLSVIIFFIISTLSSPYLLDPDVKIYKIIQKFTVFIMIPFNYLLLKNYLDYKKAIKICFYTLIVVGVYVLFQFFTGFNPRIGNYKINFGISRIITGFYSNYLTYSYIFQLYMFVLLSLLINNILKGKLKIIIIGLAVVFFSTIIFSGSRMAFISVLTGILALAIVSRNKKAILLLLASVFIFILSYKFNTFIQNRMNRTFENINVAGDEIRYQNWILNLEVFKKYPLKGIGHWINVMKMKEFFDQKNLDSKRYFIPHAHNNYIHLLSSGGVIGTLIFLILWVYIFIVLLRAYKIYNNQNKKYEQAIVLGILAGLSTIITNGLTECSLFVYAINNNISFVAAIGYVFYQKSK